MITRRHIFNWRTRGTAFAWLFSLLVVASSPALAERAGMSYRLGIFPYLAPRQTVEFYGPVAASMEAALGHPVRLESVPTFKDFKHAMSRRTYDIALIQPFDYPDVVEKYGYLPLAQMSVPLVTQLFVRADSAYQKLEDLRGSVIAMPPAEAANARMTLRALYENNLIPGRDVEVRYFNSHDSCIQQVWIGNASACGTARPPVQVFEQRMHASLRPIFDTAPIPHILFVAHPRMPVDQRAELQKLIIGWSQTDAGQRMLKNLALPGFTAVRPAEYAVMRNYDPVGAIAGAKQPLSKDLVLGIFPFFSPRQLAQTFAPVLPELSAAADTQVRLQTAATFTSFMDNVIAQSYDVILVQPFEYGRATSAGYLPVAGMKDALQGTFFVRTDSPYHQIADFKGQVVAMPPIDSAQARLGRDALTKAGLVPGRDVTISYRVNHDSCLREVQRGAAVACVTSPLVLTILPPAITQGLRTVGQTEKVPGMLFLAHKRLPSKTRDQLKREIVSWKDNEQGRALLKSLGLGEFVAVDPASYTNMPKLEAPR